MLNEYTIIRIFLFTTIFCREIALKNCSKHVSKCLFVCLVGFMFFLDHALLAETKIRSAEANGKSNITPEA